MWRYTTAFYTQDWMYWGSEARDGSETSGSDEVDNDGRIWMGGDGVGTTPSTSTTGSGSGCENVYYVADDVKLRFAYPAGKEQETVEQYYY
ncbi:MAG: hypothetical protein LBR21_09350, partial [Propionibacteriaceae bacterium]|nr:hypothetical protein [Propionibacteriaceae bacterium]